MRKACKKTVEQIKMRKIMRIIAMKIDRPVIVDCKLAA